MNIEKIDSAPNFGSLNIKKVAQEHKHFINSDLEELKKLGEQYDIFMKSVIDSNERCNGIEIIVKNLRKNLDFLQKFNRPKGQSYFYTEPHFDKKYEDTSVLKETKKAIEELSR